MPKMPASYTAYIKSESWANKKTSFILSLPRLAQRCYWCNRLWSPGFHVHHASYARFGYEHFEDLRLMCQPCHKALHEIERCFKTANLLQITEAYSFRKRPTKIIGPVAEILRKHATAAAKAEKRLIALRARKNRRNGG